MPQVHIHEVDRLEITVLVDNYADMFKQSDTPVDFRPGLQKGNLLAAQHGFSCLIRAWVGDEEHTILMDAGIAPACFFHNADLLNADLDSVEAVFLSHGHFDHFGGLCEFFQGSGQKVPLYLHQRACIKRRLSQPSSDHFYLPELSEAGLKEAGAVLHTNNHASTLASGLVGITGEIPRIVPFETGMPGLEAFVDNAWIPDQIPDDQAAFILVKGKGLVIISGCAHAGIINTIHHVQTITGTQKVHAVLGGFHLTGKNLEPRIEPTIAEMKLIHPDYVVPMHCTGWNATTRFMNEMPGRCILNTVGTTYRL